MSGRWKRSMVALVRHRQTKGPATDRLDLRHRATSRLYSVRGPGTSRIESYVEGRKFKFWEHELVFKENLANSADFEGDWSAVES